MPVDLLVYHQQLADFLTYMALFFSIRFFPGETRVIDISDSRLNFRRASWRRHMCQFKLGHWIGSHTPRRSNLVTAPTIQPKVAVVATDHIQEYEVLY